jgi:hypothetical protein
LINYDDMMLDYPSYKPPKALFELAERPNIKIHQIGPSWAPCTQEEYKQLLPFVSEDVVAWAGGLKRLAGILSDKQCVEAPPYRVMGKLLQVKAMVELGKGPEYLPKAAMLQGCDNDSITAPWTPWELFLLNYLGQNVKTINNKSRWNIISYLLKGRTTECCKAMHRYCVQQHKMDRVRKVPFCQPSTASEEFRGKLSCWVETQTEL